MTLESDQCPVCRSMASRRHVVSLKIYDVFACEECLAESVLPAPSDEALHIAYQDFEAGRNVRAEFAAYVDLATGILEKDRRDLALYSGTAVPQSALFLDYGSGGGHFVAAATKLGMPATGVEVDEDSISFGRAQGLNV